MSSGAQHTTTTTQALGCAQTTQAHRLVGDDKLLVKAITFVSSKTGAQQTFWPAVVPRTLVHAILSFFHGDTSFFGMEVGTRPTES